MIRLYKLGHCDNFLLKNLELHLQNKIVSVEYEICYNVELKSLVDLTDKEMQKLKSITQLFNHPSNVKLEESYLQISENERCLLIEIGPRLNQRTAFCTNALSICYIIGLTQVTAIEVSWRYLITLNSPWTVEEETVVVNSLHDPMTQCRYKESLKPLQHKTANSEWYTIDVSDETNELKSASECLGLAFDDWDIQFYTKLFQSGLKRNPTSVECFDLAQSNSEHSRHWFFKGKMCLDGEEQPKSLFKMVTDTLQYSNKNNKIAFHDNGSAIEGFEVKELVTEKSIEASKFDIVSQKKHLTLTAETHNFPTGVAPFPGAATGTGGRQRDQHAIGRGSGIVAGICGYCVGNLNIKNSSLSWEDKAWHYPSNLAPPSKIIIDASNGASDYGNKFGEPVVAGFFRSFGMKLPSGERTEWLKPIMFSSGIGTINDEQLNKVKLEANTTGLLVAKVGGPAYRIGVGGGCASSLMQGENDISLDFNAVQRGDAEMQQKLHRVIRACYEHPNNPLLSIHDQGAGGNGNVLKEIVEPSGAVIYCNAFTLGDKSLNTQELWTAEYQESDAVLLNRDGLKTFQKICHRERCSVDVVGELSGNGRVVLSEQNITMKDGIPIPSTAISEKKNQNPVDLDLDLVLGKMPQKQFHLNTKQRKLLNFNTSGIAFTEALNRVLKLPSVASKRFLTNKVDRSVGGLIAQQQCTGPLHTPIADVAVTALSHFSTVGTATAVGEQPIKMLVNERAGARLAVGEALTNLLFASVSDIRDVKCSANWMWPAKLPGEGARLFRACQAMCEIMKQLGIAVDGGKDSLSMAARAENEIVKSPGSLVISVYAPCGDIRLTLTPDLKCTSGVSWLVFVPMSKCKPSLGGSALAQCYSQLGCDVPDLDDIGYFLRAWSVTQSLIKNGNLISGHDISDGGFITCVLEMAFAGNCGLDLNIECPNCPEIDFMFAENLGIILETNDTEGVVEQFQLNGVDAISIGKCLKNPSINVVYNGKSLITCEPTSRLRDVWESTSFMLEKLQCEEACVEAERSWLLQCKDNPPYCVTFDMLPSNPHNRSIKVAVLREEGSNGDREMVAALYSAGFEPWDVTMQDLVSGEMTLDRFRGLVFVGGFSYADVFGSAKGWASCCLCNEKVRAQLEDFKGRNDVFSLGVCNGCQLMALLGWVGDEKMPYVEDWCDHIPSLYLGLNTSTRFESRFVSVKIEPSNSIMFKDMEGSVLGVWVAHGEGKFNFTDENLLSNMLKSDLAPLRFVDHSGDVTTDYPMNPNGSVYGIAGLCSSDGRHLAVMPHPERCFQMWQWPYKPPNWVRDGPSPWLRMFQNAHSWCIEN